MKYKYNGQWVDLSIKALDSMPVGTTVEYTGQASDIPVGWEIVSGQNKITKISNTTPTMASIVNGYSTSTTDGYSCDYINGIVEKGSNANGTYIKFKNGTMICTKNVTSSVAMTTAWESGWYEGNQSLGDFAQEFSNVPEVSITNLSSSGALVECFATAPTTTSAGVITYCRAGSTTRTIKTSVMAIGTWGDANTRNIEESKKSVSEEENFEDIEPIEDGNR